MAFPLAHGDAEVNQHRAGGGDHHIGGFDVAVDDAGRMHGFGGFDELAGQTFQIVADVAAVDLHVFLEIAALDELGDNERQRIIEFHVNDAAYARMIDLLQRHGLTT